MKRGFAWLALALLLLYVGAAARDESRSAQETSFAARLLGPVRGVAANVQWVRHDIARRDGDFDLAYSRAESAIQLDPSSTEGWMMLAHHLSFDRGSPGTAATAEERLVWFRAGIEILERGKRYVRQPDKLTFTQGTFLAAQATYDPTDCVWPGGNRAALEEASEYFRAAGDEDLARSALELADELE